MAGLCQCARRMLHWDQDPPQPGSDYSGPLERSQVPIRPTKQFWAWIIVASKLLPSKLEDAKNCYLHQLNLLKYVLHSSQSADDGSDDHLHCVYNATLHRLHNPGQTTRTLGRSFRTLWHRSMCHRTSTNHTVDGAELHRCRLMMSGLYPGIQN